MPRSLPPLESGPKLSTWPRSGAWFRSARAAADLDWGSLRGRRVAYRMPSSKLAERTLRTFSASAHRVSSAGGGAWVWVPGREASLWPVSRSTLFDGGPIVPFDGRRGRRGLPSPGRTPACRRARGPRPSPGQAQDQACGDPSGPVLTATRHGRRRMCVAGMKEGLRPGTPTGAEPRKLAEGSEGGGLVAALTFRFPFPHAVEKLGTGTGNGEAISDRRDGSRRRSWRGGRGW